MKPFAGRGWCDGGGLIGGEDASSEQQHMLVGGGVIERRVCIGECVSRVGAPVVAVSSGIGSDDDDGGPRISANDDVLRGRKDGRKVVLKFS